MDEATQDEKVITPSQFKEANAARAEELMAQVESRLVKIDNPLSPKTISILRENSAFVFFPESNVEIQEQEAMLELLSLFAHNTYQSEDRKNGTLRKLGGVNIETHWRVNVLGEDFLILTSNGRVDLENDEIKSALNQFLTREVEAGNCTETIINCLGQGRGPRLLVCTENSGIILEINSSRNGKEFIVSTPASEKTFNLEGEATNASALFRSFESLVNSYIYPPRVEIDFGEDTEEE